MGGSRAAVLSLVSVLALVALALVVSGCDGDDAGARPGALPGPVAKTRSTILAAAEARDYERLREVIAPDVFLSDFGFGSEAPDPVRRWQELGLQPLETMGAVLRMPSATKETNEGTLYQWPRFDADSSAEDLTEPERDLLLTFMSEDELRDAFLPELGYTGPRLGILADGGWWFFVLEGG
jgi:hypothetical protein